MSVKRLPPAQQIRPEQHGTSTGYNYYKCRCDDCRVAHAAYMHRWFNPDYNPEFATIGEVSIFAHSLGFTLPYKGKRRDALIARYNREHPDRPYQP